MRVFSADQPVTEVSATELARSASSVLDRVAAGGRIVVSRSRRPVALIVSLEDGIEVMLAGAERFALLRREAREELEAGIAKVLKPWGIPPGSS